MLNSLNDASNKGLNEIYKDINQYDYRLIVSDKYNYIQKKIQKKGLYIKIKIKYCDGGIPNETTHYSCILGFDIPSKKEINSLVL